MKFRIPTVVKPLVDARNGLVAHYPQRTFTIDGKILGDIGELIAFELFKIKLNEKHQIGFDATFEESSKRVQIKVSASERGPMYRNSSSMADYLIFMHLDLDNMTGSVKYNGIEHIIFTDKDRLKASQFQVNLTKLELLQKSPYNEHVPYREIITDFLI